jgi:hypothetical protein
MFFLFPRCFINHLSSKKNYQSKNESFTIFPDILEKWCPINSGPNVFGWSNILLENSVNNKVTLWHWRSQKIKNLKTQERIQFLASKTWKLTKLQIH